MVIERGVLRRSTGWLHVHLDGGGLIPCPTSTRLRNDPPRRSPDHIVVPAGFAGRHWANTEFDVLTGYADQLPCPRYHHLRYAGGEPQSGQPVSGVRRRGYRTSFYHPGDAWFYNRENVYRWLGAEYEVFARDMENWNTRAAGSRTTIWRARSSRNFETAVAEGRPLFNYTPHHTRTT